MKRILLVAVMVLSLGLGLSAVAKEQNASRSQIVITASQAFGGGEGGNLSGYANANFLYSLNDGYSYLAAYVGPRITVGNCNIYLMGVSFSDPYGWSVGPSLWLEITQDNIYFFLEGDYYVPWLSTAGGENPILPPHQYYGYTEFSIYLSKTNAIGVAAELSGSAMEDRGYEFAFGPMFTFNKIKLWTFYDTTPDIPGNDLYGIRFIYVLP
jgi:hypothetical protein